MSARHGETMVELLQAFGRPDIHPYAFIMLASHSAVYDRLGQQGCKPGCRSRNNIVEKSWLINADAAKSQPRLACKNQPA